MTDDNQPTYLANLTPQELLERAQELSAVLEQAEAVRAEREAAVYEFKQRLAPLTARAADLHRVIRTRQEERLAQTTLFGSEAEDAPMPQRRRRDGRAMAAGREA